MTSRRIISVFILLEVLILVLAWLIEGFNLAGLQMATRYSGRLSLLLFSAIFLLQLKPKALSNWLSPRYYLLFAIVHGIHLIELLTFVILSKAEIIPYRVAGGFLAYLFIFIMPVLYERLINKKLSLKTFIATESIFIYYVWFIFFMTYLPRVMGKVPNVGGSYSEHVALLAWVSTLLGYRISNLLNFRKTSQ